MRLMRYEENASPNDGTRVIQVGDNRPDINMGGMGEMTEQEIAAANAMGHVLVEVNDGGLSGLSVKKLDERAEELGVTFEPDANKDEKVSALRARLASGPEDPAEAANTALAGATTVGASGGPTGTPTGGGSSTVTATPSTGPAT
jgi:hypothetical protein